ncbi:hypothetical protein F5Y13DRAFT_203835 [Hypoxylon sp. FL1857]|nr:hypothetical protein F5Y13DRAFT_203835 [Hypoxylon sp. FL1857]
MCTGVCWKIRCRDCATIVMKNTNISGHNCREARHNGKRGCCKTGVEFTFYDKISDELCVLCEVECEIKSLGAELRNEAVSESRVGCRQHNDDEEENENGADGSEDEGYSSDDSFDWDDSDAFYTDSIDSDSGSDDSDDDNDNDNNEDEGGVSLAEDSEDSGVEMKMENEKVTGEKGDKCTWPLTGSHLWQRRYRRFFSTR